MKRYEVTIHLVLEKVREEIENPRKVADWFETTLEDDFSTSPGLRSVKSVQIYDADDGYQVF